MKTFSTSFRCAVALTVLACLSVVPVARSQQKTVIPLIVMDQVPLLDAIKNLARQAGKNYIIDPQVLTNFSTTVSIRLQNKSAEQALSTVLTNHHLVIVENPATTVARIAHQNQSVKPVDRSLVGKDTSSVIPLIVMDEVPLADALQNLGRQCGLDVTIDPKVSNPPPNATGPMAFPPTVSVRWEKLTAKQAFTAVVDNYDLALTQNGASVQVAPKK